MTIKRGDIVVILFPHSNLRSASRRPGLIIQQDAIGTGLNQSVVAMITSNLARVPHPSRGLVSLASPEGKASGIKTDSVIMLDNLNTILHSEIHGVIGSLTDMSAVETALRFTLGL